MGKPREVPMQGGGKSAAGKNSLVAIFSVVNHFRVSDTDVRCYDHLGSVRG